MNRIGNFTRFCVHEQQMIRETESDSRLSYHLSSNPCPQSGKTTPVQKGLLPRRTGNLSDLCEEGVGFGVPILQYKRDFFFPGTAVVSEEGRIRSDSAWKEFMMNLIDRHQKKGSVTISSFSWVWQRMYNRAYKSNHARRIIQLVTKRLDSIGSNHDPSVFFKVKSKGSVLSSYHIDLGAGIITVKMDFSRIDTSGLQHIYVSNELGGRLFDIYTDSSGTTLQGNEIGGWDRIHAVWAEFYSPAMDIGFRVDIPKGVQAFRGREIIGLDICWSGVIFHLSPTSESLSYRIAVRPSAYRGD